MVLSDVECVDEGVHVTAEGGLLGVVLVVN